MSSIVPARVCSQKHESELLLLFGRRPRLMRGEPICADKSGFCPDQGRKIAVRGENAHAHFAHGM